MCTGLELALLGGGMGAIGNVAQTNQTRRQEEEMAAASNRRLDEFLDRNKRREDDAAAALSQRTNAIQPEAAAAAQAQAADDRNQATSAAIDSVAPVAAIPTKASTESLIGDVYNSERARATAESKDLAARGSTMHGFGDSIFGQDLATGDAGRRIGSIGALASDDAAMLPQYQDLAIAQARARYRPKGFGSMLMGLGNVAGSYAGSKF